MATKNLIYGYLDPRDGQLRYVGGSTTGTRRPRRFTNHCARCLNWIRSLAKAQLEPVIVVLEELPDDCQVFSKDGPEVQWIARMRAAGHDLTNTTDGGDGCVGRTVSSETRTKISFSLKGRKRPQELRDKLSRATGGQSFQDQNGNVYPSVEEAARRLDQWPQNIRSVLKGRQKTCGGMTFTYLPHNLTA